MYCANRKHWHNFQTTVAIAAGKLKLIVSPSSTVLPCKLLAFSLLKNSMLEAMVSGCKLTQDHFQRPAGFGIMGV
jgi:hypothetical protein